MTVMLAGMTCKVGAEGQGVLPNELRDARGVVPGDDRGDGEIRARQPRYTGDPEIVAFDGDDFDVVDLRDAR